MRSLVTGLVFFLMYASFGAAWMGVVPLFRDLTTLLQVDRPTAAWLITIVSLAKSIVPILAGVWAARVGLTTAMRTAAVLMALGAVVPWLPGVSLLIAGRFVFGVGGAIWVALVGSAVVEAFRPERRALVNALNGVAVNTGAIVGLQVALPLAHAVGTRAALSILGSSCAVLLVALWALGPLTQKPPTAQPPTMSMLLAGYREVLRLPTTWIVSAAFTGPLALYLVVNTWLPSHLEASGLDRKAAASWLSWLNLWGIPASLAIGVLLQRNIGRMKGWLVLGGLLLPAAMASSLVAGDDETRRLTFALAGIGMFLPVAPLVTLLQRQPGMSAARIGMVMGTMTSMTYVVSSLAPNIVGSAVTRGIGIGTVLLPCCLLGLTPLVGLLLRDPDDA